MTHREHIAAQKVWAAFKPDEEYGLFTVCRANERKKTIAALKEHMREIVPEGYWDKVSWPVKVVTSRLMSIGWVYNP
jgi:hypothetical protein